MLMGLLVVQLVRLVAYHLLKLPLLNEVISMAVLLNLGGVLDCQLFIVLVVEQVPLHCILPFYLLEVLLASALLSGPDGVLGKEGVSRCGTIWPWYICD